MYVTDTNISFILSVNAFKDEFSTAEIAFCFFFRCSVGVRELRGIFSILRALRNFDCGESYNGSGIPTARRRRGAAVNARLNSLDLNVFIESSSALGRVP